jgi:hypothetical protein
MNAFTQAQADHQQGQIAHAGDAVVPQGVRI